MTDFDSLGPYRVEEKLGQGGMGTVYRGVHMATGQRVAIKVLARQMSHEPRFRRRFDAEIETLKKLTHPNIVRLIGYGEERGLLFFSMELVEGPSLLEHLRKVKRLSWDMTLRIGIEVCAALKHAHDFGVIHRDLKPANLLMEPEGGIKLTDFGIAKLFGAAEQTVAGSVLGTADYMAPEQASGGPITPRTDLYSLGSLLYACLVGRPPFGGRNLTQVIHGLKHETPPPLDLVLPEVPGELAELVHDLLEKSPQDRPPTALAVGKRLGSLRLGLHMRGDATHVDLGGPTQSEVPIVSSGDTTHPAALADESVADSLPTSQRDTASLTESGEQASPASATADSAPTRFEAVPEPPSPYDDWSYDEPARGAKQWMSIFSLLGLLAVTVAMVLWLLRDPTPQDLLARIAAAEQAGDDHAADQAAAEFLRLYPDRPESEKIRQSQSADEVEQTVRQLRAKAAASGAADELDLAEKAWLEAMEDRVQAPQQTVERLRSWLDVFGYPEAITDGPGDASLKQLARLAQQQVAALEADGAAPNERDIAHLKKWLEWGKKNRQGEEQQRFFSGLKSLYGDKPWAAPILEELTPVGAETEKDEPREGAKPQREDDF